MNKNASLILAAAFLAASALPARAQFSSGSDGSDGPLLVDTNTTLPVQADGVHNYTTITVNAGITLKFSRNALNTPVILLASGDVLIQGTINLDGDPGNGYGDALAGAPGSNAQPGPGGFPGGVGGVAAGNGGNGIGEPGGGPGGGAAATDGSAAQNGLGRGGNGGSHFSQGGVGTENPNPAAPTYGDTRLITLSGGSGGAGANYFATNPTIYDGAGGGAGGGAILIASSGTITIAGEINARGGGGGGQFNGGSEGGNGSGGGSGGSIRLMSNAITGAGTIRAYGGGGAGTGGNGLIRLEAFSITGNLLPNSSPPPSVAATPSVIQLASGLVPTIQITKIANINVPQPPSGSTVTPDVTIPSATGNPIAINISTANIPNGSTIKLRIVLVNGQIVTASGPVNNNAAVVQATLPATIGVIYATADFP